MKPVQLAIAQRATYGFATLPLLAAGLGSFAFWPMIGAANGADFLAHAVAPQSVRDELRIFLRASNHRRDRLSNEHPRAQTPPSKSPAQRKPGAGFTVVADEVGPLAQRPRSAAEETADKSKIPDATQKSKRGVELSGRVTMRLREAVEKSREVDWLMSEVFTASHEQLEDVARSIPRFHRWTM